MRLASDVLNPASSDRFARLLVFACLCFLVADRWLILEQFGTRYTDDDQTIMWFGAKEMGQGRFHEPCFYGQRYNTMLEGLVSVPLLWCGMAPDMALPVMTSALALFPYVLLSVLLYRRRNYSAASLILVLPITLPPEYGMISTMPRGFMSGIFLASLAVLPLFSGRRFLLPFSSFLAILALFANPNAVLVLAPAYLLMVLESVSVRRFLLLSLLGAVPAALLYHLAERFYELRPEYQVHFPWELEFDAQRITWSAMNTYMDQVAPLLWGRGVFILVLFALVGLGLWRTGQRKAACALAVGMLALVASFGVNKVHDGMPSVFFSWSRMFVGLPFLLALFLARWPMHRYRVIVPLAALAAAGFFGFKCRVFSEAVARQVSPTKERILMVMEVQELQRICAVIDEVARVERAGLLVVGPAPAKHLTNYGCPCLHAGFPRTVEPDLDRRTWELRDLEPLVMKNVLFAYLPKDLFSIAPNGMPKVEKVLDDPLLLVMRGDQLPTGVLLDSLGLGMRPH